MTSEEREKLERTYTMAKRLHDAFMEATETGDPPLIKRIGNVVVAVERSSWTAKLLTRAFFFLGAIATTWAAIRMGFSGWIK